MSSGAIDPRAAVPDTQAAPSSASQPYGPFGIDDRDPLVRAAVARARDGAREPIPFLYLRFGGTVRRYALSIVREPAEAEEVALCVFLKLRGAIGTYEARKEPFSNWLLRLARNVSLQRLRGQRLLAWEKVYDTAVLDEVLLDAPEEMIERALDLLGDGHDNVVGRRSASGATSHASSRS